jgi:hypothetical protein
MTNVSNNEILYLSQFCDSEIIIITNIKCSTCFEKQNNCKVSFFTRINEDKVEEWKKIAVAVFTPNKQICKCK